MTRTSRVHRSYALSSVVVVGVVGLASIAGCAVAPTSDTAAPDPQAQSGAANRISTPLMKAESASRFERANVFQNAEPWTKRVDGDEKSRESDSIINALADAGGWGTHTFNIDFGIEVLHADSKTPLQNFTPSDDFYSPDCDNVPFPVPNGGALEGEDGYTCTTDGDCHLLVIHEPSNRLYEMWRANINDSGFHGGCAAVWDLKRSYGENLRGDGCTSADAGGFPITAMLATADEVAEGEVAHALRFILPNSRIRRATYVHPGSHTSDATRGRGDAPPYGVRFRLRADFPIDSLPTKGAKVLAIALQRYGMFLADGGQVPLTVRGDRYTQNKWEGVGVDARSLRAIGVKDMEVVEMGEPISGSSDCARNP